MKGGRAAVVALWCAVAWIPFPAGFVLVLAVNPAQGERFAVSNGVALAAVASLPTLLIWLIALLVTTSTSRAVPGLGATMGWLVSAGLVGALVSTGIGGALAPFGGVVGVLALAALVLLLLAVPIAYIAVRAVVGVPVKTPETEGDPT